MDKEILKIKNKLLTKYKNTLLKAELKEKQLKIEKAKLDKLLKEAKLACQNNILLKKALYHYSSLDGHYKNCLYDIRDQGYNKEYISDLQLIIKTLKTTKDENIINALSVANQLNIEINDFCYDKKSHKAFKYFPINYKIYKNSYEQHGYFYSNIAAGLTIKYAACFDGLYYLLNDNNSKQMFKMMPKYKQKALVLKLLKTDKTNLKSCMKHLSYDKDLANIVAKYMVFSND